jgi:uncharacterized membrane protein YdjX (TVP38/TMEM64 family)
MKSAKLILLVALVIGALVAVKTLPISEYLESFNQWVESIGVWGPVVVGLAYIPATVFFIPGSALTLGAGAAFGIVAGTIAVSLGSVAGSTAAFLVGRFLARDWVAGKVADNAKFQAIDRAVGQQGFKIVLLTRLSPIFPYNLLGYMYGTTSVKLRDYVLASWIGMFPGTLLYVYLGHAARVAVEGAAGETGRSPAQWALLVVGLLATVVVTVFITKTASKAIREAVPEEPAASNPATDQPLPPADPTPDTAG